MTDTPDVHEEKDPHRATGWLRAHAIPAALAVLAVPVLLYGAHVAAEPASRRESAAPSGTQEDYLRIFRALRPRMIIEITEDNINAYLREHPEDFQIPDGFDDPRVDFSNGLVEMSARTKVLFLTTRVRVSMAPEIQGGRLGLAVRRIHAGPVRLPSSFHRGAADVIAGTINLSLDQNDVELTTVEVQNGVVRVTALMQPAVGDVFPAPAGQ